MTAVWATVLILLLAPSAAWACASCISSAFGDQTYNWAYLGLMLTPLVVCAVIGGVVAWCHRANVREARRAPATDPLFNEETT
jgi:hypothetical protein